MLCLFAVSSRFVQRASLTVNIDLSDVTNKYYTVLYRTVVVYEKKNRSLVFSGFRKIPTLGSTVQWETRQASFPTGTVGPRVGIFLSPLNTNDGFYLSHIPVPACEKDKKKSSRTSAARRTYAGRTSILGVIVMLKLSHHVPSERMNVQGFLEVFFMIFQYEMSYLVMSKKNNPLIM